MLISFDSLTRCACLRLLLSQQLLVLAVRWGKQILLAYVKAPYVRVLSLHHAAEVSIEESYEVVEIGGEVDSCSHILVHNVDIVIFEELAEKTYSAISSRTVYRLSGSIRQSVSDECSSLLEVTIWVHRVHELTITIVHFIGVLSSILVWPELHTPILLVLNLSEFPHERIKMMVQNG
jgi:hypothetical protein